MAVEEAAGTEPQAPAKVEGHAISVEWFHADGRVADFICGVYYQEN